MNSALYDLIGRYQRTDDVTGLQQAIDELLDESGAAFKLFLPDLIGARVLYISNDVSETVTSIARSCLSLTALFLTDESFQAQRQKRLLRSNSCNFELLHISQAKLSLLASSFDGIVIDIALSGASFPGFFVPLVLANIKNVLKPEGWVFLKGESSLSRRRMYNLLRYVMTKREVFQGGFRGLFGAIDFVRALRNVGFAEQRVFGFDNLNLGIDRIIDLGSRAQAKSFPRHGKLRYVPTWLYRLTIPEIGVLAGRGSVPSSMVYEVIAIAMAHSGIEEDYRVLSFEVNRKGKFVVIVGIGKPERYRLVLKIPLTENALQHMRHNYKGLHIANRHMRLSEGVFPKPVCEGVHKNIQYFVESFVSGTALSDEGSEYRRSDIISQIQNVLVAMQHMIPSHNVPDDMHIETQIDFIREFLQASAASMLDMFERVVAPVLQDLSDASGRPFYFFKSDFSVSNTMVENGAVKGLIDFDFWGGSHNRLIDYADFVLSYLRAFYGYSYAETLILIEEGLQFEGLNIDETINRLGGDKREFRMAARIAWINSVCHILEFERSRLNAKRLDIILYNPIERLFEYEIKRERDIRISRKSAVMR